MDPTASWTLRALLYAIVERHDLSANVALVFRPEDSQWAVVIGMIDGDCETAWFGTPEAAARAGLALPGVVP